MPSVTIDAGVLAAPPLQGTTGDDAHRYLDTLLDWGKLLNEPSIAIYMSERASQALLDGNHYPFRGPLSQLFTAKGIVEYDVNTIAQLVERLLKSVPSFETRFSISDVLAENLITEPDVLRLCTGTALQSELERLLVLIAILGQYCQEQTRDHSLILRNAPDQIVRVQALVHYLEHQRSDLRAFPMAPEVFSGDILICDSFRGLIQCFDEVVLLLCANDDFDIRTAIRIAIYKSQLAAAMVPDWDAGPMYRVGHHFRMTFQSVHPTDSLAKRLMRAIIETVEQTAMGATHVLRTGLGGNDPPRVRKIDNARAMRRDIDRDHHLHYWDCVDGTVEFASLSYPHDDFEIPE